MEQFIGLYGRTEWSKGIGWANRRRVKQTILYVRLRHGKFWIEEDSLEEGIATDLLEAGVPKEDIVLAFQHPDMRSFFGATGRTGRYLVEQALSAGYEVTAFGRNPAKLDVEHERLMVVQGDIHEADKVAAAVQDGWPTVAPPACC